MHVLALIKRAKLDPKLGLYSYPLKQPHFRAWIDLLDLRCLKPEHKFLDREKQQNAITEKQYLA